jgi:hypothetical protein
MCNRRWEICWEACDNPEASGLPRTGNPARVSRRSSSASLTPRHRAVLLDQPDCGRSPANAADDLAANGSGSVQASGAFWRQVDRCVTGCPLLEGARGTETLGGGEPLCARAQSYTCPTMCTASSRRSRSRWSYSKSIPTAMSPGRRPSACARSLRAPRPYGSADRG